MIKLQLVATVLNITAMMFAAESIFFAAYISVALSIGFNVLSICSFVKRELNTFFTEVKDNARMCNLR